MDWHDYLIGERNRKIAANDLMASGRNALSQTENGAVRDITAETFAANKQHIAEIEEILTTANVSFED